MSLIVEQKVENFSLWCSTVSKLLQPLIIQTPNAREFVAHIEGYEVAGVRLFNIKAPAHTLERSRKYVERTHDPKLTMTLQIEGESRITQRGQTTVLSTGDFTITDSSIAYRREFDGENKILAVIFPQRLVSLPPRATARIAGNRFDGSFGGGAIVSTFLRGISDNIAALDGPLGADFVRSMIDLVSRAFAEQLGLMNRTADARYLELVLAVREYIQENLSDPELSAQKVADAHFISVRHLQNLFQRDGMTVTAWIRERRLEMCRRQLSDPMYAGSTIRDIAERWAFSNPTYFAKAFTRVYGLSPRAYRQSELR